MTPKEKKKKLMKEMINRLNKKKCRQKLAYFDDEASSQHESDLDEEEELFSDEDMEVDEENLPMFENEEFPPEVGKSGKKEEIDSEEESESEDDGFIVDDDSESEEDDEREEGTGQSESCSGTEHINPYLEGPVRAISARTNVAREMAMITQSLSRTTQQDKQNKKKFKAELGKYQFSVHSSKNRALEVDEKTRYKKNLIAVKLDCGLKEMRNIEKDDKDFFDAQETCLYGTQVQIFPHTKKRSTRKKGRCDLSGCRKGLTKDEDKVVGAKFFDPINCMYMKNQTNGFGKMAYYWICRQHMLEDMDSSDSESDCD